MSLAALRRLARPKTDSVIATAAPPTKARHVLSVDVPTKSPNEACRCCGKPARSWAQITTDGVRWSFNGSEYDGPQYVAVCTRACASGLAARDDVWPGMKTTVNMLSLGS